MHRTPSLALLVLAAACSSAPVLPSPLPSNDEGAEPSTRYRKGDYVVYRYSGLYTEAPIELREQILSQQGDRLEIEVSARRGDEQRRWVQVVTDTPENQRSNRIDALYEVLDGQRVPLANEGNRDLFRLYEWTLFQPDGPPRDHVEQPCEQTLGHTPVACACHRSLAAWHGRTVQLVTGTCPGFLWTHGAAQGLDVETGEEALRIDVVEHGRRE